MSEPSRFDMYATAVSLAIRFEEVKSLKFQREDPPDLEATLANATRILNGFRKWRDT